MLYFFHLRQSTVKLLKMAMHRIAILCAAFLLLPLAASAQLDPLRRAPQTASPLTQPTLSPGVRELMQLDTRFSAETEKGGGKTFASWFADDALMLSNGKPAALGKAKISRTSDWNAADYQLTWQPAGAQMGPSGDMGFTWGHYEGHTKDNHNNAVVTAGRYITVWKKVNGEWKVALDASSDDAPAEGDCCKLPNP